MKKEIVHFNSMCKKAAIGIMAFSYIKSYDSLGG